MSFQLSRYRPYHHSECHWNEFVPITLPLKILNHPIDVLQPPWSVSKVGQLVSPLGGFSRFLPVRHQSQTEESHSNSAATSLTKLGFVDFRGLPWCDQWFFARYGHRDPRKGTKDWHILFYVVLTRCLPKCLVLFSICLSNHPFRVVNQFEP